jgi:hypothetical protein
MPAEGVAQIAAGLDLYQGLRTPPVFWPLVRFVEAGAYLQAGQAEAGLARVDEAIEIAGPREILSPEFHTLRGDLLLALPSPDPEQAFAAYQLGLEVAQGIGAKMPGLRAAIRLVRLGRRPDGATADAAVAIGWLGSVYDSFIEGFATPDLTDAAELLGRRPRA